MGQIVIDIPNRTARRYSVKTAADARKLLKMLDELLSNGKLTKQQIRDLKDGIRSDQILAEMRRTGESYSVQELREEFGLS